MWPKLRSAPDARTLPRLHRPHFDFMKKLTYIGLALSAMFSLGTINASAAEAPSGLSAHITPATNRVGTLSHLEFSVVVTNSGPTDRTIHPWILKNGLGTVAIFDAQGVRRVYTPEPTLKGPNRTELAPEPPADLVLKPGESYSFKYKLGERFTMPTPPGVYRARGRLIPSNEAEITVE